MCMPEDILERVKRDYPNAETRAYVIESLRGLPGPEQYRVARSVLFAAEADLERFKKMTELAHTDYRDAIMCGEYEYPSERRLRDLSKPFE